MSYVDIVSNLSVVPVGERSVSKLGDRFCLYLPSNLNGLWRSLQGPKLEVFLYVKSELEGLLKEIKLVPIKVRITKAGDRFLIYLPLALNSLWCEINKRKVKLEVLIKRS